MLQLLLIVVILLSVTPSFQSSRRFLSVVSGWKAKCIGSLRQRQGGPMSNILIFVRKWNTWYGVLRHHKAFSVADSVRYGLWLARG